MLIAERPRRWYCRCDCGGFAVRIVERLTDSVRLGYAASCGCMARAAISASRTTHGATRGERNHPLYATWINMRARCNNPNHKDFENYGWRGIRVCERWMNSFEDFLADMGPRPAGMSIDRINNDGNYEPGNCRWATKQQQNGNKRRSGPRSWSRKPKGRARAAE